MNFNQYGYMAFPSMTGVDMKSAKYAYCPSCGKQLRVSSFAIMVVRHIDENCRESDMNVLVPVCDMCGIPVTK